MKSKLIFLSFILLVGVSFVVSAENSANSSNIKTETITCKFDNSQEVENCTNIFLRENEIHTFNSSGEFVSKEIIKENFAEDYCEGIGQCSMKISGPEGYKVRWTSSCDGRNPRSDDIRMIGEGMHFTTIDGEDETIKLECKSIPQIFQFLVSGWDILASKGLLSLYRDRVGFRDYAYNCDGMLNVFNGDKSTPCKSPIEWKEEFDNICDNLGNQGFNEMCIKD